MKNKVVTSLFILSIILLIVFVVLYILSIQTFDGGMSANENYVYGIVLSVLLLGICLKLKISFIDKK